MFKRGEKEKEELLFGAISERLLCFIKSKHTIADIIAEFQLKNYKQVYRCLRFIGGEELLLQCRNDSKLYIREQKTALKQDTKKRKQEEKLRNPKQKKKKLYQNKEIFDKYQSLFAEKQIEFRDLINAGNGMQQIIDALGLVRFYWLYKYFEWINDPDLYKKCKENSIQYVKELGRLKCTAPNAPRTQKKKIPEDIKKEFLELRELGYYREEVIKLFKDKGYPLVFIKQLHKEYPLTKYRYVGENNPWFGKGPTSPLRNTWGRSGYVYINDIKLYFASSLELRIFLSLERDGISFTRAHDKIPYEIKGEIRNYFPDIRIANSLIEIKPLAFINANERKFKAAQEYCQKYNLKFEIFTENDVTYIPTLEEITYFIESGKIETSLPIDNWKKLIKTWIADKRKASSDLAKMTPEKAKKLEDYLYKSYTPKGK